MKGLKLTAKQYKSLQGLTLQQRLAKLKSWYETEAITEEQLRYFSNRLIRKEHRCSSPSNEGPRRYKTVLEGEIHQLNDELQHNIKHYVAFRNEKDVALKPEKLEKIKGILSEYRPLTVLDEFLIIAMRYPDKRLNKMAVEYVRIWRMESQAFWARLWNDENLVPMDAVRLMMQEGKIKECFSRKTLFHLLPLIEAQRDKEIQRLEWAEAVGFVVTASRRNKRLEAFNDLIIAIKNQD